MSEKIIHPIPPLYDGNSKTLILGSFPSVKSREAMFFYGHPQNRFWKLLAKIFCEDVPMTTEQKKQLVLSHNLALWDSIHSCAPKLCRNKSNRHNSEKDACGLVYGRFDLSEKFLGVFVVDGIILIGVVDGHSVRK